ncbi:hypothetical protein PC116_g19586 [Phytophthora cactorum]|uniref:Uncharacterized protein n=1 Tax=Phytophthora cactorum TaxID=29920 RepID=A0A8T1ATW7_9STRA|nr:hypothetical protein PC117_g24577 [Phytophthora cactorum]KAG4232152.1 hypothetical protein PC116_g19586 [Phytophthora cactorum]
MKPKKEADDGHTSATSWASILHEVFTAAESQGLQFSTYVHRYKSHNR